MEITSDKSVFGVVCACVLSAFMGCGINHNPGQAADGEFKQRVDYTSAVSDDVWVELTSLHGSSSAELTWDDRRDLGMYLMSEFASLSDSGEPTVPSSDLHMFAASCSLCHHDYTIITGVGQAPGAATEGPGIVFEVGP